MKASLILIVVVLVVSCKQKEIEPTPTAPVTDIDGNEYATIQIGTQVWMAENLRTSKYCNGDPIPNVTDPMQWSNLTTDAWSHYNNESQYDNPYGKLYTWHAVADSRNICPCGWHVPTDAEWTVLTEYLGDGAGDKMKSTGSQYWTGPNSDANNSSGFSGLPGGLRTSGGAFNYVSQAGFWWSSTEDNTQAWYRSLDYDLDEVTRDDADKSAGHSVRCLRD
jgi:uncharacterized protein (TIGR02145 family)